jgi:hypothetical protein
VKLATLKYNEWIEEGEVKWDPGVDLTVPDVVMLDALRDCILILSEAYNALHKVTFSEKITGASE